MDGISRDIILRKLYETCYGIHNHYTPGQRPLAIVAARQKEEVYLYSKKIEDYNKFIDLDMVTLTGLNIVEFFKQPVADINFLFDKAERIRKADGLTAAKVEAELRAQLETSAGLKNKD